MRNLGPAWHDALHGLAILRSATSDAVAQRMAMDPAEAEAMLALALTTGRAIKTNNKLMLTPLARLALAADYSRVFASLRADPAFDTARAEFETVNRDLKTLMTDWQTRQVGGQALTNDHSDPDYDNRIIDRLGRFHDRVTPLLDRFAAFVPRLAFYRDGLLAALERAEDGETAYVSDVGCESYHTLWFELHEELLRLSGTERDE